jgi:hypothetical protein
MIRPTVPKEVIRDIQAQWPRYGSRWSRGVAFAVANVDVREGFSLVPMDGSSARFVVVGKSVRLCRRRGNRGDGCRRHARGERSPVGRGRFR